MEAHSKIEEKVIKGKFVTVTITPESRDRVVEVLAALIKKAKPDRYEEFILKDLMKALENPEIQAESVKQENAPLSTEKGQEGAKERKNEPVLAAEPSQVDKFRMVGEIKSRLDPRNEKTMATFIQESVNFGKTSFGIKVEPIDTTEEAFWNWLYENKIINIDGSPTNRS